MKKVIFPTRKFKQNENIDIIYCDYKNLTVITILKNQNFAKGFCQEEIINSYIDGAPITPWLTS